ERIGKPIQLSTVATYLMRLHDKGLLMRRKRGDKKDGEKIFSVKKGSVSPTPLHFFWRNV
ncbi:hypothetical protein KEJ47_10265, partial [Candidatus Bathyarchaeota archaeon]|nr:hypothetical protein [Candidatus Bathyarchaeota archaeon]